MKETKRGMANILVVDDESAQRGILAEILTGEGHAVRRAAGVDEALRLLGDAPCELVLTDLKMPGRTGLELVEAMTHFDPRPEIVVITAFGTIESAVKAMRQGAYDYLTKPVEVDELLLVVERALEKRALREESRGLKGGLRREVSAGLIAESPAMRAVLEMVAQVAASDATVMVRGESGTGKERIAKLIHYSSARAHQPLVCVNCAAFTETLLESELFGHEKGAFTGADRRKIGLVESAHGGSLFLDEIGDMSFNTQARLLRVLQEREIRRVGGTESLKVDIRVIAATNRNLEDAIRQGRFREDLFYRLNIIPMHLPSLRDRREDIPHLFKHFLSRSARPLTASEETLCLLREYAWPGNVRELEALAMRLSILMRGSEIRPEDLPMEMRKQSVQEIPIGPGARFGLLPEGGVVFEDLERDLYEQAMARTQGNMMEASRLLGLTYRAFRYRAIKFGLG